MTMPGGSNNSRHNSSTIISQLYQKIDELKQLVGQIPQHGAVRPTGIPGGHAPEYLVIANGKRDTLTEDKAGTIDPRQFDFFLDLTRGVLFTRIPGEGEEFQRIEQTPLQSEDVKTLVFLVEHAGRYFGCDNLGRYLPDAGIIEPNTLAKRLSRIRKVVQRGRRNGPFIRRTSQAYYSVSRTGFAFYFDSSVSYCLVRFAE